MTHLTTKRDTKQSYPKEALAQLPTWHRFVKKLKREKVVGDYPATNKLVSNEWMKKSFLRNPIKIVFVSRKQKYWSFVVRHNFLEINDIKMVRSKQTINLDRIWVICLHELALALLELTHRFWMLYLSFAQSMHVKLASPPAAQPSIILQKNQ